MLSSKRGSALASCCGLRGLQQYREMLFFRHFMGLRSMRAAQLPLSLRKKSLSLLIPFNPTTEARRFQSMRTVDTKGDDDGNNHMNPNTINSSSFSSSSLPSFSSPIQSLYKSSHRGRGDIAMPKAFTPKPLLEPAHTDTINRMNNKSNNMVNSNSNPSIISSRSSCMEDSGPVPERPLTPLQKRQLLFKDKAAFALTPQALRRLKYLISQYNTATTNDNSPGGASKEGEEADNSSGISSPKKKPVGIRIGVRRRGCSGYSYTVNYYFDDDADKSSKSNKEEGEKKASDLLTVVRALGKSKGGARNTNRGGLEDVVVEQDGVKVVVDGNALFYVLGTEMDYVIQNVEEKFTFKNPNQKHSCGCEESFMPFGEEDDDD